MKNIDWDKCQYYIHHKDTGHSTKSFNNAHKVLIREAIFSPEILEVAVSCNLVKDPKLTRSNIASSKRETRSLIHPHIDALIVTL